MSIDFYLDWKESELLKGDVISASESQQVDLQKWSNIFPRTLPHKWILLYLLQYRFVFLLSGLSLKEL